MSRKLKILVVSKDIRFKGGVYDFVSTLLSHVCDSVECQYFCIGDRYPGKVGGLKLIWPFIDNLRLSIRLLRHDINCIHLNPSMTLTSFIRDTLLLMTSKAAGTPNILVFFHGWDERFARHIKSNPVYNLLMRRGFARASAIVVLAEDFKNQLISMGVPYKRIIVGTTMFDSKIFDGVVRTKNIETHRLLFLSRFVKEKGVFELLEAFRLVNDRFPNTELVLAGDGPALYSMEEYVKLHDLKDVVKFTGYLRGLEKGFILVNSDIFIFPSYYGEGCPISLLEAMAAGLPIVSTSVGGIADVFKNGKNGILLNSVSARSISEAVSKMINDEESRLRIGRYNRTIAWKLYEARIVSQRINAIYREVANTDL